MLSLHLIIRHKIKLKIKADSLILNLLPMLKAKHQAYAYA